MRLSSSSSLILATLASSSSLSVLAAPAESNDQARVPSILDSGSNPITAIPALLSSGLERRQALLDPIFGLTDAAGLKGIISTVLGLLGLQRKDAVNAESSDLTPDQVSHLQSMIKDMTGGLPLPLPVDSVPNLLNNHAAFAFDAAPTSSIASASSVYSSATPTFSSTMYAGAEAFPTPSGLPVSLPPVSLPVSPPVDSPLSPSLPANPPNTPIPPPSAPAPPAPPAPARAESLDGRFPGVKAEAATDPSSTSASPNFGTFPSTNATSSSVPSSTATPY